MKQLLTLSLFMFLFAGTQAQSEYIFAEDFNSPVISENFASPSLVDIDNDGDLDLFVGQHSSNKMLFYRNTGTVTNFIFEEQTGVENPLDNYTNNSGCNSPSFVDLDNDGDLDAMVGTFSNILHYYKNDGTATVPDLKRQSVADNPIGFVSTLGDCNHPAFVDIDGDLDQDVFISDRSGNIDLYRNTGSATNPVFEKDILNNPLNNLGLSGATKLVFADLNGDNLPDVLIGSFNNTTPQLLFYANNGTLNDASFELKSGLDSPVGSSVVFDGAVVTPALGDLDNDGDLDMMLGVQNTVFLYRLEEIFNPFITTWKTDNLGTSEDNQITIPTAGTGYDYTIDWGDGTTSENVDGDTTHTYATAGTYTVSISGDFPQIYFNNGGDSKKLLSIEQWGNISWTSLGDAFSGCSNMIYKATDAPDLSNVTSLGGTFRFCSNFNGDISNWDVSTITSMRAIFQEASSFNQDISNWNTSSVINMSLMFRDATVFNQDISRWETSNVTDMTNMFRGATVFNQNISGWNTSKVRSMLAMFFRAFLFDQNLSQWDVSKVTDLGFLFTNSSLSQANYDSTLIGWSEQTLRSDVDFGAVGVTFCDGVNARQFIIDNFGWNITDGGINCPLPFITTWKTDNPGTSEDNQITIPTAGTGYDYTIDWGDGTTSENVDGDTIHTYATAGTYTVSISGDFPRIYFNNLGDKNKLLTIEQWGDISWENMNSAFEGCINLVGNFADSPDLSQVTDMDMVFAQTIAFEGEGLGDWDVSSITSMVNFFTTNSGVTDANYDSLLIGWSQLALQSDLRFDAFSASYCEGALARQQMIENFNWDIRDNGIREDCPLGIGSNKEEAFFLVYPNPTNGIVFLEESVSWVLTNSYGEQLEVGEETTIDLSSYEQGIYFLQVENGGIVKLLKE